MCLGFVVRFVFFSVLELGFGLVDFSFRLSCGIFVWVFFYLGAFSRYVGRVC